LVGAFSFYDFNTLKTNNIPCARRFKFDKNDYTVDFIFKFDSNPGPFNDG